MLETWYHAKVLQAMHHATLHITSQHPTKTASHSTQPSLQNKWSSDRVKLEQDSAPLHPPL